jgi:hypothetical protein
MRKNFHLLVALIAGIMAEGATWGLGATFAKFGPCGPANKSAGIFLLVHSPGFWVSDHLLPRNSSMSLPLTVLITAALITSIAFLMMRIVRVGKSGVKTSA